MVFPDTDAWLMGVGAVVAGADATVSNGTTVVGVVCGCIGSGAKEQPAQRIAAPRRKIDSRGMILIPNHR